MNGMIAASFRFQTKFWSTCAAKHGCYQDQGILVQDASVRCQKINHWLSHVKLGKLR